MLALVQETAKALGTYRSGTATTGSTSTLTDLARRVEEDTNLEGAIIVITPTGANTGTANWRRLSANVQATGILTIIGTFAATPSTDTYDLYLPPFHPVYHVLPALNMALQEHFSAKPVFRQVRLRCPHGTTRLALPSNLRALQSVSYSGGGELLSNEDFYSGTSNWTMGGNSLANTGEDRARVLSIATGSQETTQDAAIVGDHDYEISARMLGNGTQTARLVLRWLDSASAQIGSNISVGTVSSATAWTRVGATYRSPSNAAFARVVLDISATGTAVLVRYASVAETRPWITASDWRVRNDAGTRYIEFGSALPWRRDVLFEGEGVEATLTADGDSVTLDDNEQRYLCARTAAKCFRMLTPEGGKIAQNAIEMAEFWDKQAERVRGENAQAVVLPRSRPSMRGY